MSDTEAAVVAREPQWSDLFRTEDWWAIWIGSLVLAIGLSAVWNVAVVERTVKGSDKPSRVVASPWTGFFPKIDAWKSDPRTAIPSPGERAGWLAPKSLLSVAALLAVLLAPALWSMGRLGPSAIFGWPVLFALAVAAYLMAAQEVVKQYNFEYVLWALCLGLIVSNTIGTPRWLGQVAAGEFFIKTGLVLLGAEILLSKLLALGLPGVLTSWIVTPIVLVTTFWFGQRVLKMSSPTLNMVISADMSVCGVSAAIAAGAACRAKKEEVSYAIGVSLFFTAVMMVFQPLFIKAVGMDPIVGAAWIGGTIDSTGAVAAAGAMLGKDAKEVAATVKMIQNVLIGVIAFGVAAYWSAVMEPQAAGRRVGLSEIWKRFPRFTLGFLAASAVCSSLPLWLSDGSLKVDAAIADVAKPLREWLFCLAFVSIGLDTNFRELWPLLKGGKPLTLYLVGQAWNLLLSFIMCYIMFGIVFAKAAS